MDSQVIAIPSISNINKWFIFRDNGQEVTVTMNGKGGIAATDHKLTPKEATYLIEIQKQKDL